jgi:hypothetical protein
MDIKQRIAKLRLKFQKDPESRDHMRSVAERLALYDSDKEKAALAAVVLMLLEDAEPPKVTQVRGAGDGKE